MLEQMNKHDANFPTINLRKTGMNLQRIMDKQGLSVKAVQEYLNLGSVQSVYNWCNGINMPSIDNLYALSQLFQLPIDAIVCGNRAAILPKSTIMHSQEQRLYEYYKGIHALFVA